MAILKIKDENGKWIGVPAIKGEPGADGKDGHTPVKGTDYWNEEDKEEVKGFVDDSVVKLENVLQNILKAIQDGGTTTSTVAEIDQLIVSYLETKTVEEVES